MTLERLRLDVARIAETLRDAAYDDTTAVECRALQDLAALLDYVERRFGELGVEEDPRLLWIEELCLCGHARGEHYVDAPHLCEGTAFVEGARASFAAVLEGFPPCPCRGFEAEDAHRFPADTLTQLHNVPSEPPPAAADEAP